MLNNTVKKNSWKVQPDTTTLQVVDPRGINEQLDYSPPNWHGICISLAIIGFVGILVTIAALLLIPLQIPPFYGRRMTLEDLKNPHLKASPLGSQWLSDHELVYLSEENGLLLFDIRSNSTSRLISNLTLHQIEVKEFFLSANRQHVLLRHDVIEGRLFTQESKYSIYDVGNNRYYPLKLDHSQLHHPRYQHAQWLTSPFAWKWTNPDANKDLNTSKHTPENSEGGCELIVIDGNDIFYLSSPHGSVFRLTTDGKENEIYNGIPDLMYEEILRSSHSTWPSSSGEFLAYLSFNDTEVKELPVLKYGGGDVPTVVPLRYATVTTALPGVSIWVVEMKELHNNFSKWKLEPPEPLTKGEYYVLGIGWVNETKLWISLVSRNQSTSMLATCGGVGWKCTIVHVNHRKNGISPTVQSVIWTNSWVAFPWPIHSGGGWWYNHIAVVGSKGGRHPTPALNDCHVERVLASHPTLIKIFFLGSRISEGTEKQDLFVVSSEENSLWCISCSIGCPRVVATLNKALTHAVVTCIGSHVPSMYLVSLQNQDEFYPLHVQNKLRTLMVDIALPETIYRDVMLSSTIHSSVDISIPPGWAEEDESFLYSFVIHILGVEDYDEREIVQHLGWDEFIASSHQIAHARIKLRGNNPSEHVSTRTMAKQLGDVVKNLLADYKFLDGNQLSLWGWGSGASLALELFGISDLKFKCVLAINPVMDWKKYGSYWSERFLGPLNSEGAGRRYEESNLLSSVTSFGSSKVMLMISTTDPMCHHSYSIARALIQRGIDFQQVVYPDSTFALRHERDHVVKTMEEFFVHQDCARKFS